MTGGTRPPSDDDRASAPTEDSTPGADHGGPRTIGEYRIVRKLGEGGMGVVYEAEQAHPRRAVALKVMRGGPHVDDMTLRLFKREVETLARLKHPHIAAIYESGSTADGQHYFAMELVRGLTLDSYLRKRDADNARGSGSARADHRDEVNHRLGLFRKVCEAVNYAHQRGVIHRDIKPSNVLVPRGSGDSSAGALPDVKILDFGLARITDSDLAATTLADVGQIMGTLPYMSPEQVRGNVDEIDVRSDVYSLGVLLYEVLTGGLPYDVKQAAIHEAARIICEQEPQPLSMSHSGRRRLDNDLETIVHKALQKEPQQRYQSALTLADDVERFLTDQPILARPPSALYQLRKMVARHKVPFAAALAGVVLVTASAVALGIQGQRVARERDRASRVTEFLVDLFESPDPVVVRDSELTAREVLDQGVLRIRTELGDEPEVRVQLLTTMARVYLNLGLYDDAAPLIEESLNLRRETYGDGHAEIAEGLEAAGVLAAELGEFETAEERLREAVGLLERAHGAESPEVVAAQLELARVLRATDRYDEAETLLRSGLEVRRAAHSGAHPAVAESLDDLASVLQDLGRFDESVPMFRESLAMRRATLGEEHRAVSASLNNLAVALQETGQQAQALSTMQEAFDLTQRIYGDVHPATAVQLENLGDLYQMQDDFETAMSFYFDSLEVYRQFYEGDHPTLARSLNSLGDNLRYLGRYEEAEPYLRESLAMRRRLFGPDNYEVSQSLNNVALFLHERGRPAEAIPMFDEAMAIRRTLFGDDHPSLGVLYNNKALAQEATGDLEAAAVTFDAGRELRRRALGEDHLRYASITANYATNQFDLGRDDAQALALFQDALRVYRLRLGDSHRTTLTRLDTVAQAALAVDQTETARAAWQELEATAAAEYGERDGYVGRARLGLARIALREGEAARAERQLADTVALFEEWYPDGNWRLGDAMSWHAMALLELGRGADAEPLLGEGLAKMSGLRVGARQRTDAAERLAAFYDAHGRSDDATRVRETESPIE